MHKLIQKLEEVIDQSLSDNGYKSERTYQDALIRQGELYQIALMVCLVCSMGVALLIGMPLPGGMISVVPFLMFVVGSAWTLKTMRKKIRGIHEIECNMDGKMIDEINSILHTSYDTDDVFTIGKTTDILKLIKGINQLRGNK